MEIIAYAKDCGEKVFIGTFESLDVIHDQVEMKLEELGLRHWVSSKNFKPSIYIVQGYREFKLVWGMNRK